jgi:hypothetical protein
MSKSRLVSAWVLNELNESFRTVKSLVEDRGGKHGTDGSRNHEKNQNLPNPRESLNQNGGTSSFESQLREALEKKANQSLGFDREAASKFGNTLNRRQIVMAFFNGF